MGSVLYFKWAVHDAATAAHVSERPDRSSVERDYYINTQRGCGDINNLTIDSLPQATWMVLTVAVIGGGPGGLFAALGLSQVLDGADVKVYERSKRYRDCGAGISVQINGMKAIQAVSPDLLEAFEARGCTITRFEELDQNGDQIPGRTPVDTTAFNSDAVKKQHGVKPAFYGWSNIQQLIYDALPEGTVQFGHALDHMQEDEDGVLLQFSDQPDVRADFVVAADGYFSPAREIIHNDGPPEFQECILWRGRMPWSEGLGFPEDACWGRSFLGGDHHAAMYHLPGMLVGWALSVSTKVAEEKGIHYDAYGYATSKYRRQTSSYQSIQGDETGSGYERALKIAAGFAPQFHDFIKQTPPTAVVEHGLFARPPETLEAFAEEGWGKGRVTLIGDAIHPARPTGQGLNIALEDGAVLAAHVQENGLSPATLRAFEKERVPRVATIVRQEEARGKLAYGVDAKAAAERIHRLPLKPEEFQQYMASFSPKPIRPARRAAAVAHAGRAAAAARPAAGHRPSLAF